jgi:hypothetical protein
LIFYEVHILDDIRANWGLEDIWQRVSLVAGGAIGTNDGDDRSARHFCGGCADVATIAKFEVLKFLVEQFKLCGAKNAALVPSSARD